MKSKLITISIIALFSTLLWVFISLSDGYFTTVELPVQFVDLPHNYAIGNTNVQKVNLSLKGQGWQLAKLFFGRSPVFSIAPSYKPGEHSFNLRNAVDINSWLISNMQVTEIQPDVIKYKVENIVSKKVSVKPVINLSYKDGYGLVSNIVLLDDTVTVTGAKSIIERLEYVETKTYDFFHLEHGINRQLELKEIPGIEFSQNNCSIEFVVQKIVDKTFNDILVETKNVPNQRDLLLFPNKVTVVVRGGINVLGQLTTDAVRVYVDFEKAIIDTVGRLSPEIELPKNTSLVDIKPNSLGYIIKQY